MDDFLVLRRVHTVVDRELLVKTIIDCPTAQHRDPVWVRPDDVWQLVGVNNRKSPTYFQFQLMSGKHAGLELAAEIVSRQNGRTRVDLGHAGGRGFLMRYLDIIGREIDYIESRLRTYDSSVESERGLKRLQYIERKEVE
ncbi:hypothetical protein ACWEDF_31895 [Micromonospora chersina]